MKNLNTANPAATPHAQTETPNMLPASNKPPSIFIDRIAGTINITNSERKKGIAAALFSSIKNEMPGWITGSPQSGYKIEARLHPPINPPDTDGAWVKDYVLIQVNPKKGIGGFVRYDLNPARFTPDQLAWIYDTLDEDLDLNWFDIWSSKVTRVDIAADFPGLDLRDYCFERPASPVRWVCFNNGDPGTISMGATAKGQHKVYDKKRQMKASGQALTRFEVLKKPNCSVAKLLQITNPFANYRVYNVLKAPLPISTYDKQMLHMVIADRGLEPALRPTPEAARSERRQIIQASVPAFWDPEALWTDWEDAVHRVMPAKGAVASYYPDEQTDQPTATI